MKLDIKTLIVLAGLAVTFGGFYYGTEYRLSTLESEVKSAKKKNSDLEVRIQKLSKRMKRIEK
jgi:cell division protein FtsL